MRGSKPKLERRLQLDTRTRVNAMLYQGWRILSRDPLQLKKGRQVATIEGNRINTENVVAQ